MTSPGGGPGPLSFVTRAAQMAWLAFREGRLPLSPRRWLIDLRHLSGVMDAESGQTSSPPPVPVVVPVSPGISVREQLTHDATRELELFLATGGRHSFKPHTSPVVSIVLVLFNRAELTWRCLRSLTSTDIPFEVVLVDNASTDSTGDLLDRIENAVAVRQTTNVGFGPGVNAGANVARGQYLLLLNNDTELLPGALDAAVETAVRSSDVGAVGGRLILPDGRLQEAGSLIWRDGSTLGYGRDQAPFAPEYSFRRDVDYCSAAFLLTPRELFLEAGGFDATFSPAYYEDTDYCVWVWKRGKRVIYEPGASLMHYEFASSTSALSAAQMQLEMRQRFVARHSEWLTRQRQHVADRAAILCARDRRPAGQRVLVFDDRVPHHAVGFGFPRAVELVRALTDLGHFVTLYPLSFFSEPWESVYRDIPREVEVMTDYGPSHLKAFWSERRGYYDTVVVSRHHNMARLRAQLGDVERWGVRVIYDAEAVSAFRDVAQKRAAGESISDAQATRLVEEEVRLARGVDAVLAVSELEAQAFAQAGIPHTLVARHAVDASPTERSFDERTGILFVGAFDPMSPNADSVLWFVREALPRINDALRVQVPLTIVGHNVPPEVHALASETISVVSDAADLRPYYDRARLFIAPTRFAAGIPLKIIHAAANGLPVVCTSLLARQLACKDGTDLLVADVPEDFAAKCALAYADGRIWQGLRDNALQLITRDYTSRVFRSAVEAALDARP